MSITPDRLSAAAVQFVTERHLATLTTLRADGSPHVVAVGFTWDPEHHIARVITTGGNQKSCNARRGGRAAIAQVDGPRWITLEGPVSQRSDPEAVADAERRYTGRFRVPRVNPKRVVVEIAVDRVLGSRTLLGDG